MTRASLHAGAGRARIDLDGALPADGFDAVLHPLEVRVVLLARGSARVAVAALELTSLPDWAVQRCRAVVASATGAAGTDVLVGVSHTFSAPHLPPVEPAGGDPDPLALAVEVAVRQAARAAADGLVPAVARFGRGRCRVNVCRDVPTPHGWWLGADDTGPTDDDLPVLRLDARDGTPVALLAGYAVQAAVLDGSRTGDGRRLVSSDLFGAASRYVEQRHGGVALLLPAAGGDQAPTLKAVRMSVGPDGRIGTVDAQEAGHVLVDLLGERLGEQLLRAADGAAPVDVDDLGVDRIDVRVDAQVPPVRREDLVPSRSYGFVADGSADVPVVLVRLGSLRLVGVRPELNAVSGVRLRERAGDRVMLATLVDGAAKYLADASGYDRITYEAMNSRYARGAAEVLVDAITDLVLRGRTAMTDPTSTASVATDRPQRYGKQLVSHLSRRATGSWDDVGGTGVIEFADGHLDLSCTSGSLDLTLTCPTEVVERLEDVVGRHLVRFGARAELVVAWQRADGSPGSRQVVDAG